jgi:hypothetical protein
MDIQQCREGNRVLHKETGKPATISSVSPARLEVLIRYDNGATTRVPVNTVEALGSVGGLPSESSVRKKACPQCAQPLALDAMACPSCGYTYRGETTRSTGGLLKLVMVVVVLVVVGLAVWKFLLGGKLP